MNTLTRILVPGTLFLGLVVSTYSTVPTTPNSSTLVTSPTIPETYPNDASISNDASVDISVTSPCPTDMVLVEGMYCSGEVEQTCLRWAIDSVTETPLRCLEFSPVIRCSGSRRHMSFCMDRYEYPNRAGAYPAVMVSWYQARQVCESIGKRLCTGSEWTFACEGENMNPYPYGDHLHRNSSVCNIDHQTRVPDRARLANPATSIDEATRLYEAVPSGSMPLCVSDFGVHDMTGNVDEWVVNESGVPYQSGLKGGWFGAVRARCRPMTTIHNESFSYYQISTRCCSDP